MDKMEQQVGKAGKMTACGRRRSVSVQVGAKKIEDNWVNMYIYIDI